MAPRRRYTTTLEDSDSDEEFEIIQALAQAEHQRILQQSNARCGSIPGRVTIQRNRLEGHERLYRDYFGEDPVYPSNVFRRRFLMSRSLFCCIQNAVEAHDNYFVQTQNSAGTWGLSPLQKVTAGMRMLAYGSCADSIDDYVRIGESTAILALRRFVQTVVAIFSDEYLRSPNENDIARLLEVGKQRGFPGMLGSIDCMHWKWKNCPSAWSGMYTGHVNEPTIIVEVVASYDLWIWHAFFGLPGSNKDINILDVSPVFAELSEGRAPKVNYTINGHDYTMGYYLADGIYPSWETFVKTIPAPQGNKMQYFAAAQESCRKDVERAFGVLQAPFAIVRGPARFWDVETLKDIMKACIIIHNMIVEDERDAGNMDYNYDSVGDSSQTNVSREQSVEVQDFISNQYRIQNRETHAQL